MWAGAAQEMEQRLARREARVQEAMAQAAAQRELDEQKALRELHKKEMLKHRLEMQKQRERRKEEQQRIVEERELHAKQLIEGEEGDSMRSAELAYRAKETLRAAIQAGLISKHEVVGDIDDIDTAAVEHAQQKTAGQSLEALIHNVTTFAERESREDQQPSPPPAFDSDALAGASDAWAAGQSATSPTKDLLNEIFEKVIDADEDEVVDEIEKSDAIHTWEGYLKKRQETESTEEDTETNR
ncbi:hypothetical protein CYMTET_19304 [Cymbomonas tetramitiformis]|uniref:Uncharacterized protein n=1 Tax=Cymbomonas tetramitiformis TaxID=36881 RepID=A0AAE0L5B6_9CHLO|nr:hypothetical protein CYMTET_19304 [Cymbomonas tetramitiformis]